MDLHPTIPPKSGTTNRFSEEKIMPNKHPLLSCVFLAFLFSLPSILTFAAVQQSPIAGHWEGAIKLPTGALNFSVDFTVASDGKLAAAITIPQQGAKDLPLANVGFENGEVTFGLPNVPGDPKFRGKLSTDGQKIEGTFSQGGADLPCGLERKADPVAAAKEALAGFDDVVTDAMKKFEEIGRASCREREVDAVV